MANGANVDKVTESSTDTSPDSYGLIFRFGRAGDYGTAMTPAKLNTWLLTGGKRLVICLNGSTVDITTADVLASSNIYLTAVGTTIQYNSLSFAVSGSCNAELPSFNGSHYLTSGLTNFGHTNNLMTQVGGTSLVSDNCLAIETIVNPGDSSKRSEIIVLSVFPYPDCFGWGGCSIYSGTLPFLLNLWKKLVQ